jgi:hypothetical protein
VISSRDSIGARLLVLVPSSRRKHYRLDIIFYLFNIDSTIQNLKPLAGGFCIYFWGSRLNSSISVVGALTSQSFHCSYSIIIISIGTFYHCIFLYHHE